MLVQREEDYSSFIKSLSISCEIFFILQQSYNFSYIYISLPKKRDEETNTYQYHMYVWDYKTIFKIKLIYFYAIFRNSYIYICAHIRFCPSLLKLRIRYQIFLWFQMELCDIERANIRYGDSQPPSTARYYLFYFLT